MGNSRPEDLSAGPQDRVKAKRNHTLSAVLLQLYREMEGRGRKDPRYSMDNQPGSHCEETRAYTREIKD